MTNKKVSKLRGPVLGIMGFMLSLGIMESPAFAEGTGAAQVNAQDTNITTQAAVSYSGTEANKDYFISINKAETSNGVKVTVDKAIGSKHDLKVVLKIESDKPFDKTLHGNTIFELNYGDKYGGHTQSINKQYLDDKTMILTLEKENYEEEYPEKGNMRIDVVFSNFKANIGIDIPVDFTELFKNATEKNISGNIPEINYTLNKIESDVMGTRISYIEPKRNEESSEEDSNYDSIMLARIGDKLYKLDSSGSYINKNEEVIGYYRTTLATYDRVKDEKNISLIPIISKFTTEDFDKLYEGNEVVENTVKDSVNNVNYENNFEFSDGTKGEVYKIERNNNNMKLYLKGASEKESLLMASNIFAAYQYEKEENSRIYYDNNNMCIYKDPNESLGYVVELENLEKGRMVNINFNKEIKYVDKYNLEDEIKLLG